VNVYGVSPPGVMTCGVAKQTTRGVNAQPFRPGALQIYFG
jgi:hypothetical protein